MYRPQAFGSCLAAPVVERASAWQSQRRRLGKDSEQLCTTSVMISDIRLIRLMLRRMTRT
jgi:hypothetical protein